MTPQDVSTIQAWAADLQEPPRITLIPADNDPLNERFVQFCDQLKKLVPSLTIKKEGDTPFPGPALLVGRNTNIFYSAIPESLELPPFLKTLGTSREDDRLEPKIVEQMARLDVPLLLTIFISPHCPHCPATVSRLIALASSSPKIRLTIVDGVLFDARARADQIRSVPTVFLDGEFRWSGQIALPEILDMALHRDPIRMSANSLRQMLEEGNAAQAAQLMADRKAVFPALLELLVHPRWSVRLGAMVTVEYLVESEIDLSVGLADMLWERFERLSPQVQGDIVHVFGQVNSPATRQHLRSIVDGPYDDEVRSAAAEELQSLAE